MKLDFDSGIFEWLADWNREFEWDAGNRNKNEKHGVTAQDIENIFSLPVYVAGKIAESEKEDRWLLLGETNAKGWAVIVTIRGKKLRVISCRRQRKMEGQFYEKIKKENRHED